jgi:uncharacterized protein (TIRG00374 family)
MNLGAAESDKSAQSSSPLRRWLYISAGLIIGSVFFYLAARKVNFEEVLAAIYAIHLLWIVPLTTIYILNLLVRGLRWRLMFPDESRPSVRHAVDVFIFSKVGNSFMPGRLGELLRASVMGRLLPSVGMSGTLATIVVEKMFDVFGVLILLGVALLSAPLPPWLANAGLTMIGVFPAILLVLWLMDRAGAQNMYQSDTDDSRLACRIKGLLFGVLRRFSTGLYALRTARHFALLSALTLVIWFGEVCVMYLCFQAFSIPAPFVAAVVTMVFLSVGSILPAAPGFIGTYQLFIVAALSLYAVPENNAFALSIFLNLYVIVMISFLGLLAVIFSGGLVNLRQVFAAVRKKA